MIKTPGIKKKSCYTIEKYKNKEITWHEFLKIKLFAKITKNKINLK